MIEYVLKFRSSQTVISDLKIGNPSQRGRVKAVEARWIGEITQVRSLANRTIASLAAWVERVAWEPSCLPLFSPNSPVQGEGL
jgi:hypothetical protein